MARFLFDTWLTSHLLQVVLIGSLIATIRGAPGELYTNSECLLFYLLLRLLDAIVLKGKVGMEMTSISERMKIVPFFVTFMFTFSPRVINVNV